MKKKKLFLAFILIVSFLVSCTTEIGYTLPVIPIRIGINATGAVTIGIAPSYSTPYGTFDLHSGTTIQSIRNKVDNRVLIVRIDKKAVVYELEEGREFEVIYDDENVFYKKVGFFYQSNGDIILELETIKNGASLIQSSCPGAPTQQVKVGSIAYVCTIRDRVLVREGPSKIYSEIVRVTPGTELKILSGPECANNWSWWKIQVLSGDHKGVVGWISEGGDSEDTYFICPSR